MAGVSIPAAISSLDLSRLPAPAVVAALDYEPIRTEIIADFQSRWPEFDALLESDPAIKLIEVAAYREMLLRARVNDAARSVMLAFAGGSDLDHLGALYAVPRMVITPANDGVPAVLEDDMAYRRRLQLAPEAFATAGSLAAWRFHALSADPRVLDADVWSPAAGEVVVAIQSREGDGLASPDLVQSVRAWLMRPDIKPLTDSLAVRSVVNVAYSIDVAGFVLPGPSTALIRAEMIASLGRFAAVRRSPGRDINRAGVTTAASVAGIDQLVVNIPAADLDIGQGEVPVCTGIAATVTTYGG